MGNTVGDGLKNLVQRIEIRKVPVDIVAPRNLQVVLAGLLQSGKPSQIMFVRTWDVIKASRNPYLRNAMHEADLVLPVSKMISRMARFLGYTEPHRFYPFTTTINILTWLEDMGGSMFLLGGVGNTIQSVEQNVKQTFPKIRFLGKYQGIYPRRMDRSITLAVQKANPDMLLCGPGLKNRDLWIYRRKHRMNSGLMLWSGEWFDFVIQRRRRPPKTSVAAGREWISELYTHPGKILRFPVVMWFWFTLVLHRLVR